MNQDYVDTVRLLLAVAPAVFRPPRFALKGGTALNLFVQDMPRLSVDIDVAFTDHTLDREAALKAIAANLRSIKSAISAMGHRADLPIHNRYHTTRPRYRRTVWQQNSAVTTCIECIASRVSTITRACRAGMGIDAIQPPPVSSRVAMETTQSAQTQVARRNAILGSAQ